MLLDVISHQSQLPRSKPTTRRPIGKRFAKHDLAQFVSKYCSDCLQIAPIRFVAFDKSLQLGSRFPKHAVFEQEPRCENPRSITPAGQADLLGGFDIQAHELGRRIWRLAVPEFLARGHECQLSPEVLERRDRRTRYAR